MLANFSNMRKQFIIRLVILLFGLGMAAVVLPSQTIPVMGVFGEVKGFCAADEIETEEASNKFCKNQSVRKKNDCYFNARFLPSQSSSMTAYYRYCVVTLIFSTPVSRRVRMNP